MRDTREQYELLVRPKGRTPADEYNHRGETWIEGRYNSWYEIELVNHSHERVLAVLSVDGVGVIDGAPASYDSRGFVLEPQGRIQVSGWLQNTSQAAQFVFKDSGKSYAEQMGQGGNPGVIGVAWFPQKVHMPTTIIPHAQPGTWSTSTTVGDPLWGMARSTMGIASSQVAQNSATMGTAWGERIQFNTRETQFEKASETPHVVMVLRYDNAQNLQAMGIKLNNKSSASRSQAFPGNNSSYCAPPPVWVQKHNK